jgi:uncharacterized membrane protein
MPSIGVKLRPMPKAIATRIWDVALLLLVAFPLFTGGLWIRRPGLNIELSQLGVPVVLVALLTWALHRRIDPRQSLVIPRALEAWDAWKRSGWKGVLWGSLAMATLFSLASLRRHWSLGSNAYDLGIFQGALWNLIHGGGYVSPVKGGIHLFRDHLTPTLWIVAPLFKLYPKPETLLVLQGTGVALGALPLYALGLQYAPSASRAGSAGQRVQSWVAASLPLIYWLYLPTRNGNAFDFHPDTLMLGLGLAAIAGFQSVKWSRRALGSLAFLLLLGCKESSGVVATGLGIAWMLGAAPERSREFCRRVGFALIPFGLAWFWIETRWIPERFFAETYAYSQAYAGFEPGLGGILLAPFQHPALFVERLLGPARLRFLFFTLGGLAFLPLFHWRAAVAAVPAYLMLFLTDGDHRVSLFYYYGTEASIPLFWALPLGMLRAAAWWAESRPRRLPLYAFTAWVLFWPLALSGRSEMYRIRVHSPSERASWFRSELVPCVGAQSLAATSSLVPHLGGRPWAVALPHLAGPNGPSVECVIEDSQADSWPLTAATRDALLKQLNQDGFREVFRCESVQVLERNSRCLECIPRCFRP